MNRLHAMDLKADRLDCWKEIAVYLCREVRTVQLWEKTEALPIHRHVHKARGTVYGLRSELDAWRLSRQSSSARVQSQISLIVSPFKNIMAKGPQTRFLDGVAEDLITSLGRLQPERIVVRALASKMLAAPTPWDLGRLARTGRADYILLGSVRHSKNRLRVCTQLVRSSDLTYVWADSFEENVSDTIIAQRNIASRITRSLIQLFLLRTTYPASSVGSAFEAYVRGRYYWNKRTTNDINTAISYFEQAISANPNCGLAYVGLADCYNLLGFYGELAPGDACSRAKSAATRALQIDAGLAEAHVSLAEARFGFDWDWAGAARGFRRAIELDPAYPTARHWYGNFLSALGRHQEAIAEVLHAHQLDPLSLVINVWLGVVLQYASRYEDSIRQYRKALELDPHFALAYAYLAQAHEQTRYFSEALSLFQKALTLSGGHRTIKAMLGHAYAVCGSRDQARQILNELEASSGSSHSAPTDIALIYNGLGDRHNALNWLERAYEERCPSLLYLSVEPRFTSLRSESRFQGLLRRVATNIH